MNPQPLIFPGLLSCRKCPSLCTGRIRVVPGYGTFPSKIMFVAQSPGYDETHTGRPLTGKSGQFFTACLKEIGMDINSYFKTNVISCHPPQDRKATAAEIKNCSPWLQATITTVDPDIIVCMGDSAYRSFLPDEKSPITQIRGSIFEREIAGRTRTIIPTIHPAFVIRNPIANKPTFIADLLLAKHIMEGTYANTTIPFRTKEATWAEILEVAYDPDKRPYGFDVEADSLARDADILGVGLCNTVGDGRYYPFGDSFEATEKLEELRASLEDPTRVKIISNVKYERHVCRGRYGIKIQNYYDTLIEAWLLGTVPLSLKDAMHSVFGIEMARISKFTGMGYRERDQKGKLQLSMAMAQSESLDLVVEYAAQDPDASLRLHQAFEPLLRERGLWDLYTKVELPFTEIIIGMEEAGVLFDPEPLRAAAPELLQQMAYNEAKLHELAGVKFNPNSAPQNVQVLYHNLGGHNRTIPPKYAHRQPTYPTDKIYLGGFLDNPIVRGILTAKAQRKLFGATITGLEKHVEPDGRIHATINQTGTETGRVSVSDPNLQQVPSRARDDVDVGIDIHVARKSFVAPPGHFIVAPDLSQIEMRIAAHLSQDPTMIRLISEGADLHNNSVYGIYKTNAEEVAAGKFTPEEWKNIRYLAKTVGFGCLYLLQGQGLIARTPTLNLTIQEANDFIDGFYNTYPGLRDWQRSVIKFTREHGYAETILGRRRYLPDITSSDFGARGEAERASVNVPIQGSAADMFKMCILAVQKRITDLNLKSRLVLQVHDEIVIEVPENELDRIAQDVIPVMTEVMPLRVPVKVDVEYGPNWGDLKTYKPSGENL